jgi:hypothetical protein
MIADMPPQTASYSYTSTLLGSDFSAPQASSHGAVQMQQDKNSRESRESWPTNPENALEILLGEDRGFRSFAADILELTTYTEEDEAPTKPSLIAEALYLTPLARVWLAQKWTPPRIATDGYGGIRLSWRTADREIRAILPGDDQKARYIYWEDKGDYGSVQNFTPITLFSFLDRLQRGDSLKPSSV